MSKPTPTRVQLRRTLATMAKRVFVVFSVLTFLTSVYSITRTSVPVAEAAAPTTLNFQARLMNNAGNLVPDGYYNIEFKLYNVDTAGTALWTETRYDTNGVTAGNDNRIQVKNGYISAYLGDTTALPTNIWNQQLWLTMNIGGSAQTASPTWDGEMNPRIRLTSVPYAFRATVAESAETLSKNTGSFTGTVDFMNLTADRRYLFPDTSLATTASPGTICVYNGAASNCPAASGSAYYIQNDTVVQTQGNFNIQARDSTTAGTIAGVLRGAAAGQTVDLLQFQATNGSVLAAVTATGNLQVASSVDVRAAGTLSVGTSTATAISIGGTGITTTNNGALTVTQAFTANGGAAITGVANINTSGTATTTIGAAGAGIVLNGAVTANEAATFNNSVTVAAQQTLRLVGGTTAQRPGSPTEGMLYFDTDTKQLLTYANGKWQADRTEAVIVAASNSSQANKDAADYVADGNTGTAADGDQVQINAALTAASGKKVILLAGTYVADASISIPNNTTLAGIGNGTVVEFGSLSGGSDTLIENTDQSTGMGVVIENMKLDGRNDLNPTGTQNGIDLRGLGGEATDKYGFKVSGLNIRRFNNTGINIDSSTNGTITANTIQDNTNYGIYASTISAVRITNNDVSFTGTSGFGIYASIIANSTVTDNTVNLGAASINLSDATNNVINDNNLYGANEQGLFMYNGDGNTISGNQVNSINSRGLFLNLSDNNNIAANRISETTVNGIYLVASHSNSVSSNLIKDSGSTTNNNAINLSNADSNTIVGNTITDSSASSTNYAINVSNSTSDTNYLASNTLSTGTVNDVGTGTVYGGQTNTSGNFLIQPAGTIELMKDTNITGNLAVTGDGSFTGGDLTVSTTTATDDRIKVTIATGGAARFDGTLTNADLTAARTWTLPDASGILCLDSSVNNCSYLTTTAAATGFIQNQNAGPQATSNFYISGSGRTSGSFTADTSVLTPTLDTASAVALNIGTTNATQINLNKNVSVAGSNTFTVGTGATNLGGMLTVQTATNQQALIQGTTGNRGQLAINNVSGGQQSRIVFQDAGSDKWEIGKNNDNSLYIWDATYSRYVLGVNASGNLDIQPGGGNVTIGNAVGASVTSLNAGSGGIFLNTNTTVNGDLSLLGTGSDLLVQGTGTSSFAGNVSVAGTLYTPTLDTASAVALSIGTTNATSIDFGTAGTNKLTIMNSGDLRLSGGSRSIFVNGASVANAAGFNLAVIGGAANGSTTGNVGGALILQGGAAAGSGNNNGGSVTIAGGAGTGTGGQGLVGLAPTAFTAVSSTQSFGTSSTLGVSFVDTYSTIPMAATTTGLNITIPAPTIATVGRVLYVSNVGSTYDFNIILSGTSISIALKPNTTATLIWNGNGWTAAGASSSTDLQSAYNNTLTSAGGAEILLNPVGGAADGFTIRNNSTTPIAGGLLEVQSSIGTNLFSVNNFGTELANNGGAETSGGTSTTFPANTWTAAPAGGTVTRTVTAGQYVTGQAGAQVVTTTTANTGIRNNLSGNPVNTIGAQYQVSFTAKSSINGTAVDVQYSRDGGTNLTACTNYGAAGSQNLSNTVWTKVTCTITIDSATAATDPDLYIRKTDAATAPTIYIDNLSFIRNDTSTQPSNVQIGGGVSGGPVTLFTLDRSSSPPVANGNSTYYGSMYYDTTTGRIQCYEADGWGACGSAPDNIITLTPEYTGAVLNGNGIGVMTADFCANETTGVTFVVGTLCALHETRNFYRWTSPQATDQTYSIYVNYKLPATFKEFTSDSTIRLTGMTDNTTTGSLAYDIYRKDVSGNVITKCGATTTVTSTVNTWQSVAAAGNELTSCTWAAGDYVVFKITASSRSNANVYIENLDFTFTNR